jgi:hypothetical protein
MNKNLYPKNWSKEISPQARERAGQLCQFCGKPNGQKVKVASGGLWFNEEFQTWIRPGIYKVINGVLVCTFKSAVVAEPPPKQEQRWLNRVVLTVAHLGVNKPDGTPGNKKDKMDCRPENLAALCSYCHLTFDIDEHMESARNTRFMKRTTGKDGKQKVMWDQSALAAVAIKAVKASGAELPEHQCECGICGKTLQL